MDNDLNVVEYQSLRQELTERIKFLHQTLNLLVILQVFFFVVGYFFHSQGHDLNFYLLMIPLLTNSLAFNYQSNQMSLEAITKYIYKSLGPRVKKSGHEGIWEWERYFADYKGNYKFEAFFKVIILFWPNLIPFIMIVRRTDLTGLENVLLVIDIILFIIMGESFRYKLHRVK